MSFKTLVLLFLSFYGIGQIPNWSHGYPSIRYHLETTITNRVSIKGDTGILISFKLDKFALIYILHSHVPLTGLTSGQIKSSPLTKGIGFEGKEVTIHIASDSLRHYFYITGENESGLMPDDSIKLLTNVLSSNIALKKKVIVDSNLPWPGYQSYKAVDGSITTKWNSSNATGVHWMYVDLGGLYSVSKIVVKHNQSTTSLITRDFLVQYCDAACSGGTYTTVTTYTGNTSPTTTDFVNIQARYVRIYITKPSQYGNSAAIYELEVHGH